MVKQTVLLIYNVLLRMVCPNSRAIVSDEGSHFCNKLFQNEFARYAM